MVTYQLVAISGPDKGSTWAVKEDGLVLGRDAQCDAILPDATVSRRHCRLSPAGHCVRIEDLGSRNPVLVNGIPCVDGELRSGDEIALLFEAIYKQIKDRPEDPDVDKEEVADTVQKIEQEAAKGEQANVKKVERWLGFLANMAPDILKVTAATLANPVAGVATAIRLIAEKAQAETG